MITVCIVGVYFGNLPSYFDLWLKSAEQNPTIDFLIFTDQKREKLPVNVRFEPMTLNVMKQRAENVLCFPVSLDRPYKCCDFKVIYGLIFEDFLREYDYWGHCDFDLIWGDLRGFFDMYHIENYDKFLPLGHLSLYRNTYENNRRYQLPGSRVGDYKEVFANDKSFAFDELLGIYRIFEENKLTMFKERIFADISRIYNRFRLALNDLNYDHQVFYWKKGHVYRSFVDNGVMKQEEYIYIHFKKRGALPEHGKVCESDMFYITATGFFPADVEKVTEDDINRYNPYPGRVKEKIENFIYKLNTKKNRILSSMKRSALRT